MFNTKSISLPTPGKDEYETLCEVAEEYSNNLPVLYLKAEEEIQKHYATYKNYANITHSRSHIKFFDPIELEDNYTLHIGLKWSKKTIGHVDLITALVKTFDLSNGSEEMTLGMIQTDNADNPGPRLAFFTAFFWEILKISASDFFLEASRSGVTSSTSNSCRALYLCTKGVAIGRRYCKYDVFEEFVYCDPYTNREMPEDELDSILDEF